MTEASTYQSPTQAKTKADKPARSGRMDALDGGKAIPLMVVLVAHFGWHPYLPGAWIAINHFFLFSGFVITLLLLRERAKTGRVGVFEFYRRRARRLLPGLFVLLTTLSLWGIFLAPDHVRRALQGDIFATLGYVMNWRLVMTADQYFNEFGSPSMLRHAWTLSVEEQFYAVAPWLIIGAMAFWRRRLSRVSAIAGLALFSAWLSSRIDVSTVDGLARAYYSTDIRMQAILVGVALAFALGPDSHGRAPRPLPLGLVHALAWASWFGVMTFYFLIPHYSPWMWNSGGILLTTVAIVPVAIACADPRSMAFKRVMAWRPFVYIGVLTYGLYLWHWPIERWMSLYGPELPVNLFVIIGIVLTVAVAHISFKYLEFPIIRGGVSSLVGTVGRARILVWGSLCLIIVLAFFVGRVPSLSQQLESGAAPPLIPGTPAYVPNETPTRVTVFGDSTALYLFDQIPSKTFSDMDITNLAVAGCDIARLDVQWTDIERRSPEDVCLDARASLPKDLKTAKSDVFVLMSGSVLSVRHVGTGGEIWDVRNPAYRSYVESQLDDVFNAARQAGIEDLRLMTIPCRENDPAKFVTHGVDTQDYYREHPSKLKDIADPTIVNSWFREWAEKNNVQILDLYEVLGCERGFSRTFNGVTLFSDYFHFHPDAAAMIWTWLAPELRTRESAQGD